MQINTMKYILWYQKGTDEVLGGFQQRPNYVAIIVHINQVCMLKKFLQSLISSCSF